jgi:hypothetical protein
MSVALPGGQNRIVIYGPKDDSTYVVQNGRNSGRSFNRPARTVHTVDALGNAGSPRTRCGESRSPAPRPRTPCEVPVISRDLKHHLLGYFVPHIIGKIARFVGAFAPVLRVVNKGGRHKVALTRPLQVARTSPPRFHPINQTDHYPT